MEFPAERTFPLPLGKLLKQRIPSADELKWASLRLLFYTYSAYCLLTVYGGHLTAPLFTWLYFGDWRFWRHWSAANKLWGHGWKMSLLVLSGRNNGFMLSVSLTSPPASSPDPKQMRLNPTWEFGSSCGPCTRCCEKHNCPILDRETGLCGGYNSFFWRYFNCGRYPAKPEEIEYYVCPKWWMKPAPQQTAARTDTGTDTGKAGQRSEKVA